MKLASYHVNDQESYGIITDQGIIDLPSKKGVDAPDLRALLDQGMESLSHVDIGATPDHKVEDVIFLPVIPNPGMIFCLGLNTYSHLAEVNAITGKNDEPSKRPWVFLRTARAQVGHNQPLEKPNISPLFDFEGEIALVIGKYGRHISEENAMSHVAGYSCYNEGSIRDYQMHSPMYAAGKNFPRSGGFGPWLVTADEIDSLDSLKVTTRLNGNVVQEMPYSDLIYPFEKIISYISEFSELHPGDVIVTGSGAGVGICRQPQLWMQDGDVCEVEVTGVGTLSNSIKEAEGPNRGPLTRTDANEVFFEALGFSKR